MALRRRAGHRAGESDDSTGEVVPVVVVHVMTVGPVRWGGRGGGYYNGSKRAAHVLENNDGTPVYVFDLRPFVSPTRIAVGVGVGVGVATRIAGVAIPIAAAAGHGRAVLLALPSLLNPVLPFSLLALTLPHWGHSSRA